MKFLFVCLFCCRFQDIIIQYSHLIQIQPRVHCQDLCILRTNTFGAGLLHLPSFWILSRSVSVGGEGGGGRICNFYTFFKVNYSNLKGSCFVYIVVVVVVVEKMKSHIWHGTNSNPGTLNVTPNGDLDGVQIISTCCTSQRSASTFIFPNTLAKNDLTHNTTRKYECFAKKTYKPIIKQHIFTVSYKLSILMFITHDELFL